MVNGKYAECEECINQNDCYIWFIAECLGAGWPCKITDDDDDDDAEEE